MAKPRKKRKPMTPEQRAAAAERLKAAREKKMKDNPPQFKSIDADVLKLAEDNPLYFRKVQSWIKTQKDLMGAARQAVRRGEKGAEARLASHQKYINNLEKYLREGIYTDLRYGEYQECSVRLTCNTPAYDPITGEQKRSYGVFYPDLGYTYTGIEPAVE